VLGDQLVTTAEIGNGVPVDIVGALDQQIDEVVNNNRDLSPIDRLELDQPIRFTRHSPVTLQRLHT
jgi:hypothetical protein